MSEILSIKIKIVDREYPMQVEAHSEAILRQAGKLLNEQVQQLRTQFQTEDRQDLLSMVAFDCMVELLTLKQTHEITEQTISERLNKWETLIANTLKAE